MLPDLAAVLLGLVALVWGADRLVGGAAALAQHLGMSPLLIGITVIGFGTSAPEILVSAVASLDGAPGLAIGNAVGSNIANIGLILGITALVAPFAVHSRTLSREFPVLIAVTLLVPLLMAFDGHLGRLDGSLLLALFVVLLWWAVRTARAPNGDPLAAETEAEIPKIGLATAVTRFLVGLIVLLAASRALVWGASNIARDLGVSELVIGLTIVAIGTSLPELAASVMSALRKEPDLALGNVLGSNLFNLLAVLCLPGIIAPGAVDPDLLTRDLPVMVGFTLVLVAMAWGFDGYERRVNRIEGGVLLAAFLVYLGLLVHLAITAHAP
ncbi:MAG: calcium/sodium antiporter [Chromatiaceae bacterium]|jgi:cation:H+ antiporter|nr:calcium/sodium antiporter [Chromatiaceae bacterium]